MKKLEGTFFYYVGEEDKYRGVILKYRGTSINAFEKMRYNYGSENYIAVITEERFDLDVENFLNLGFVFSGAKRWKLKEVRGVSGERRNN